MSFSTLRFVTTETVVSAKSTGSIHNFRFTDLVLRATMVSGHSIGNFLPELFHRSSHRRHQGIVTLPVHRFADH